jgi:hypothetical protein
LLFRQLFDPAGKACQGQTLKQGHHDTQYNDTQHSGLISDTQHSGLISDTQRNGIACHYAECRDFLLLCLSVVMLYVVMLHVVMLNVILLNVIMLHVIMLNVVLLSVVMLNVAMLNVVMLNVMAPKHRVSTTEKKVLQLWVQVSRADFKPDEDPTQFKSVKTGRGPLTGDWKEQVTTGWGSNPGLLVFTLFFSLFH